MKKRIKVVLGCIAIVLACLLVGLICRAGKEENRITTLVCSDALIQDIGETKVQELEERLKGEFSLQITEQTEGKVYVQVVADYADTQFCFPVEREITAEECRLVLEPVGYDSRFHSVDEAKAVYLELREERYLLGTILAEEEVFFLPTEENEYELTEFCKEDDVRAIIWQPEESYEEWEYIWVDSFADFDTIRVKTAQESVTDMAGSAWEAVDGTEREITLTEECKIIYVERGGYRITSLKNFHSCVREGWCGNVYFVGWEAGRVDCVISIFMS